MARNQWRRLQAGAATAVLFVGLSLASVRPPAAAWTIATPQSVALQQLADGGGSGEGPGPG